MPSKTNLAGITGWGFAVILGLVLVGQCTKTTSPTNSAGDNGAQPLTTRYVSVRSLNCRAEPVASAPIVRGLSKSDAIQVADERDGWAKIDGTELCWVMAQYLADAPVSGQAAASVAVGIAALPNARVGERSSSANTYTPANSGRLASLSNSASSRAAHGSKAKKKKARKPKRSKKARYYDAGGCPCSGNRVCIGPRGGRYCITSGGNKRYGV